MASKYPRKIIFDFENKNTGVQLGRSLPKGGARKRRSPDSCILPYRTDDPDWDAAVKCVKLSPSKLLKNRPRTSVSEPSFEESAQQSIPVI